jgi:hypothetical protein
MSYLINKYNGEAVVTLEDGVVDSTHTSLKLLGRNFVNYGEIWAENLVHLLENFANPTAPEGNPLTGQIWFNTTDFKLYVYDGTHWVIATGVQVGNTLPNGLIEGQLFWDTDRRKLYAWTFQPTPHWELVGPPDAQTNDVFFDHSNIVTVVLNNPVGGQILLDATMLAMGITAGSRLIPIDHGLNKRVVMALVYDNQGRMVIPDEIYLYNTNRLYLDVSSFLVNGTLPLTGPGHVDNPTNMWCIKVTR